MSIKFSAVPYLYNDNVFDDVNLVRAKLHKEIPFNKKLSKITELNKLMKFALVSDDSLSPDTSIPPEYFIIPCDREFIIETYEDDEHIKLSIRNKRVGRFEASFNILVIYMNYEDSIVPITVFVTNGLKIFDKNDNSEFIIDLTKE